MSSELIKRLKAYRLYVDKTYSELSSIAQLSKADVDATGAPLHLLLSDAIAALESMQWVKCDERLPEAYTEVMVWPYPSDDATTAQIRSTKSIPAKRWMYAAYETNFGTGWRDCNVTHWMPLPAPPKVEQE